MFTVNNYRFLFSSLLVSCIGSAGFAADPRAEMNLDDDAGSSSKATVSAPQAQRDRADMAERLAAALAAANDEEGSMSAGSISPGSMLREEQVELKEALKAAKKKKSKSKINNRLKAIKKELKRLNRRKQRSAVIRTQAPESSDNAQPVLLNTLSLTDLSSAAGDLQDILYNLEGQSTVSPKIIEKYLKTCVKALGGTIDKKRSGSRIAVQAGQNHTVFHFPHGGKENKFKGGALQSVRDFVQAVLNDVNLIIANNQNEPD